MPNLFERFDKKTPHYPNRFRDLIDRLSRKRAFDTSSGTEEETFSQGKIFANYYECFLRPYMQIDKYALKAESSLTVFEFVSEGPKGPIRKLIQFQNTNQPNVYNLAFGDKNAQTGEIDDLAVSNNGDTDKVLATVVAALYAFFDKYPDAFVYATGSTAARTRLYRMGISRFYDEMSKDFDLYGQVGDEFYEFVIAKEYAGFLAQRKLD